MRDHAAIARGLAACSALWAIADRALGEQTFFSGDTFGIADIALGPMFYVWDGLKVEKPATANFLRSAAYKAEEKLGKKFTIHSVKEGDQTAYAIGWTTKPRAKRKPSTKPAVTPTPTYEIGSGGGPENA